MISCSRRTESIVSERGVFMYQIASVFLLQRLKGSMSGDTHDFSSIKTQAVIKYFILQGKVLKEIHAILIETLGDMYHRMPLSKTGWPSLNVIFLPVMCLILDSPKQ